MRLSTKGRYAVMAMTDLARHGADRAVSLAEIAARQEISLSYLEQLFARMRRGGLVKSVRGPGGGYRLARPAAETSVAEIVVAVDEPLRATRCAGVGSTRGCMASGERCLTHHLWEELGEQIHMFLAGVSLADVLDKRFAPRAAEQTPVAA
jgi:Rrf2 family iron-sulfur cluster assembly transcriptional regulator